MVAGWGEAFGAAGRMLNALADRYPRAASRTEFVKDLGLAATGGTFSTYLSRLVSNGLADRLPDGSVRASDELFPGAGSGKA